MLRVRDAVHRGLRGGLLAGWGSCRNGRWEGHGRGLARVWLPRVGSWSRRIGRIDRVVHHVGGGIVLLFCFKE